MKKKNIQICKKKKKKESLVHSNFKFPDGPNEIGIIWAQ